MENEKRSEQNMRREEINAQMQLFGSWLGMGGRGDNSEPKLQGLPTSFLAEGSKQRPNHGILLYGKKRLELSSSKKTRGRGRKTW